MTAGHDSITPSHEQGDLAADDFVHEWPFHDHDHVQQILEVLKRVHVVGMSPTMRAALDLDGSADAAGYS